MGGLVGGSWASSSTCGWPPELFFSLIPAVSAILNPRRSSHFESVECELYLARPPGDRHAGLLGAAINAPPHGPPGWKVPDVGIAVIDSGIYNHPDLNAAIRD